MSSEIGIAVIVAFVLYPFAMLGLSSWIDKHNKNLHYRRLGFAAGFVLGCMLALKFWITHRISKYPPVDFIAAAVFVLSIGATGACAGSLWARCSEKFRTLFEDPPDESDNAT